MVRDMVVPMISVVVVEDELDLQEVLRYDLTQSGYAVSLAQTGREGIALCHEIKPDIVLLDLMLPDMSGKEVFRALKQSPQTKDVRVIMVTAKGEEIDRIVGLELGADDYVVKPFSLRELRLRIEAVLRRNDERTSADSSESKLGVTKDGRDPNVLVFGNLRIDRAAHRVFESDRLVELTPIEYKLLVTLLERKERVQSREVLLADVWGLNSELETRTVDTHVKRLRQKLSSAGEHIQTVRGVGYRISEMAESSADVR